MILFLRTKEGRTVAEAECFVKSEDDRKFIELHASVDIPNYSHLLLTNLDRTDEVIADFSGIDELRGWLWESYFMGGKNDPDKYDDVIKILRKHFYNIMIKYKLNYIED